MEASSGNAERTADDREGHVGKELVKRKGNQEGQFLQRGHLKRGRVLLDSGRKGSLWRSSFSANRGTACLEAENRPVMSVEAGSEMTPRAPAAGFTPLHNHLLLGLGWACSLPPKEENMAKGS